MGFVAQWREIESSLPEAWGEASLSVSLSDPGRADRAAALLGPLAPGRSGHRLRLTVATSGGSSPGGLVRALERLDGEGIRGSLDLVGTAEAAPARDERREGLAASWSRQLAGLPADWSHLQGQVDLTSTDHLERAALLLSPLNPSRFDDAPSFRFRCARSFGYGVSAAMARRCFERLDEEPIRGGVSVLRVVSDSDPVETQGPVWYVGGRAV
ncbi:MAG: hypothetical protein ABR521_02330 [Gaiellaceae bacterium]